MEPTTETSSEDLSKIFEDSLSDAVHWFGDNVSVLVRIVIIAFLAWLFIRIVLRIFNGFLQKTMRTEMYPTKSDRDKRIKTLNSIAAAIIKAFVWTIAVFMILDALGINVVPLLASAGIIGVALGFGTQSLVKDFITGMFIIAENQYRVGDFIEVQNVAGTVESISMRTTVLRDFDGSVHYIPNGSIVVSTNRTMGEGHLVMDLTVEPDADLSKVERAINKAGKQLSKLPEVSDSVTEPPHFVRISEFNDKGITVKVSGTVASGKQPEVKSVFLSSLRQALKQENIKIISAVSSKYKK